MIKNMTLWGLTAMLWLSPLGAAAQERCYLTVAGKGDLAAKTEEIALSLLSSYVEKVIPPPLSGLVLTQEKCVYQVSLLQDKDGLTAAVAGRKINAYGKSQQQRLTGVEQALLRALYQQFPHKKNELCQTHPLALKEDCQGKTGLLQITSEPAAAQVVIDGVLQGQTALSLEFAEGHYQLAVKKPGYQTWQELLQIKAGETLSLKLTLELLLSSLTLQSSPSGATVYVNEQPLGQTPITLKLPAQSQRIALKLEGYQNWQREVVLKAEEPLTLAAKLKPELNPAAVVNGYVNQGDGTILDTQVGLLWQARVAGYLSWQQALNYARKTNQEGLFGYDDWRLPSQAELQRVYQFSKKHPDFFPAAEEWYWSATKVGVFSAWLVSGGNAEDEDGSKEEASIRGNQKDEHAVRLVRSVK